jgi:hypothetical protein
MKELMSVNDLKIDKVDTGDGIQYVGYTSDGKTVIPIGEKMAKSLTPGEQQQGELTRRGQDITMRGQDLSHNAAMAGVAARGGSAASNREITNKFGMYKWASSYELRPTGEVDYSGKPVMTRVQRNPQLAAQLEQELYGGGQGQSNGQETELGYINEALNSGVSPEQILQGINSRAAELTAQGIDVNALLGAVQPRQQQSQRQPAAITDTSNLDAINNNWQY